MKKSKILISAVTMFSLCITPMSVYAQVDPNSNIENTISQTKSAENLPTPVLQEKEIEVSNGTGYSLNNIQGAETVKALEQGTIVISYKATGENAIQSLFSVGNGTNGNQNRHFHIYVTNSGGVGMELRNTDGDFSKSPIKATSEGMVTFGTTVTQGYLDVPVSDFSSLTGRKPLSIQYIFEHVDDYLLGDRHPTE